MTASRALNSLLLAAYAVVVALLSLLPATGVGPGQWDKLAHLVCYAVFAWLAFRVVQKPPLFLYLCIAIVCFGGLLEVAQSYTPGRMMSAFDLLANSLGVVLGALVARRIWPGKAPSR